jgi:hypothetical protein
VDFPYFLSSVNLQISMWAIFGEAHEDLTLDEVKQLAETIIIHVGNVGINKLFQFKCEIQFLNERNTKQLFEYFQLNFSLVLPKLEAISKEPYVFVLFSFAQLFQPSLTWMVTVYGKLSHRSY